MKIDSYLEAGLPGYKRMQVLRGCMQKQEHAKRDTIFAYLDVKGIKEYESPTVKAKIVESQPTQPILQIAVDQLGAELLIEKKAITIKKDMFEALLKVEGIKPKDEWYVPVGAKSKKLNVTIIPEDRQEEILQTTAQSLARYLEQFARE